jgi:hypothetical protein
VLTLKQILCSYLQCSSNCFSLVSLLRELFRHIKNQSNIEVPFSRENAFYFDNETFRFSALYKNGIEFSPEGKQGGRVSMRTLYNHLTHPHPQTSLNFYGMKGN